MRKCDIGPALRGMFRGPSTLCGSSKPKATKSKRARERSAALSIAAMFAPSTAARPVRAVVSIVPARALAPGVHTVDPRHALGASSISRRGGGLIRSVERPGAFNAIREVSAGYVPLQLGPGPSKPKRKRASRPRVDLSGVEATVELLEHDPQAVPQPIAPPGYRPPTCATNSPEWGEEYTNALADATERAAIEAGEDEQEFRRLLRLYFSEHPRFAEWQRIEQACVVDYRRRHPRRTRRTVTSSMETSQAIEEASRDLGYDIRGSAEHLDRLTLGSQAAYWRRVYKRTGSQDALRKARDLEARNRAAKRKGRGISSHRA